MGCTADMPSCGAYASALGRNSCRPLPAHHLPAGAPHVEALHQHGRARGFCVSGTVGFTVLP